jgi:hypothetical protein
MAPLRAEPVHLVEIIYELDLRSFDGRPLPASQSDADADPQGYFLADNGAGEGGVLYSAMGKPLTDTSQIGLWTALRFRDLLSGSSADVKTLEPIAALPYSPDLQSTAAITPIFDITIAEVDDGDIVVEVDGVAQRLPPGEPMVVATGERTVSLDEVADAVLEAYAAAGVPQADMPSRESVAEEVALFVFGGKEEVTFHARVVAENHGPVGLAGIDLATTLDDARSLSREGPYEEALETLETLLDIMPYHAEGARLFHQVLDLVEAGAVPALAMGNILFEEGQPDEGMRELWAAAHAGFVTFASPGDLTGSIITYASVEEQTFRAHLPAGLYRMSVDVPGFQTVTMELTLEGDTQVDVPLVVRD